MGILHHIRIIGEHHAMHHHGVVVGVTDNVALATASPASVVHRNVADQLVEAGHAEWVGVSPAEPPVRESHAARADRHLAEHADMLSRHASEFNQQHERHQREHDEAMAAAGLAAAVTGI